jgi:Methyltransferase domain
MAGETHCPLCRSFSGKHYHSDRVREYLQCEHCGLVFVPPEYLPNREEEKAEYDKHENFPGDPGYRRFLSRLVTPLIQRVPDGASGLDFGCGPGPALVQVLGEKGYHMAQYDPIYFPGADVLDASYDFICATEVVEHMHRPDTDLERIWGMLRSNGWLGVMTKLVQNPVAFSNWHYIRDPTHVCFYSERTWQWWAHRHGAIAEFIAADVILIQRS